MSRPRVGFVGVGWIGRNRMEAILRTGAVEVIGVVEPDAASAREACRLAPLAVLLPSLEALLDLRLDGVAIATPSALHAEQAIRSLQAGAAVFCQKPLARSEAEVRAVIDAAREADRLLAVDLSYRCTRGMKAIRDLVRAGALGRVYAVNLVFHNAYGPDKPWFYDAVHSGGGCVMDLGVHLVDLALWTLGFPEVRNLSSRLFAKGRTLRPGEVEDYAVAMLNLDDGATVQIACSWHLPAGCDAVISAEFFGTSGGARLRNEGGSFLDFTAEHLVGTRTEVLEQPPDEWSGRAAAEWALALSAGAAFRGSTDGLAETAAILDRIYGR